MKDDNELSGAGQTSRGPETEGARFRLGVQVLATDGICGELTRFIVDPVARALTHLVVTPKHHHAVGHLVPVALIEDDRDPIRLRCTTAEFRELDDAEDIELVPESDDMWSYGGGQVYSSPQYGLGLVGGMGAGGMGEVELRHHKTPQPIRSDHVPVGEVQVKRGDQVHAVDGWIGSVQGLVLDPADHHVTHVLLAEGHFWGHKQVAIPIGATSTVDNGIQVQLTRQQVEDLPPVDLT